jgi:hypothetical protein
MHVRERHIVYSQRLGIQRVNLSRLNHVILTKLCHLSDFVLQ